MSEAQLDRLLFLSTLVLTWSAKVATTFGLGCLTVITIAGVFMNWTHSDRPRGFQPYMTAAPHALYLLMAWIFFLGIAVWNPLGAIQAFLLGAIASRFLSGWCSIWWTKAAGGAAAAKRVGGENA